MASHDGAHEESGGARNDANVGQRGRNLSQPESPSLLSTLARPTSSSSTSSPSHPHSFSSLPHRSGPGPIASRRAQQIQADEGIVTSRYRPPAMRLGATNAEQAGASLQTARPATSDASLDEDPNPVGSRLFRGRARAGTLPSSWNDVLQQQSAFLQTGNSPEVQAGIIGDGSTIKNGHPWNNTTASQLGLSPSRSDALAAERANPPISSSSSLFPNYATPLPSSISSVGSAAGRITPSRQARSTTMLEFDKAGLYSYLGSESTAASNFTPPSSSANPESSAASQANRNRSGSLTSSVAGLGSNAFGPSIFTSTWADQPGQSHIAIPPTMPFASRSNIFPTPSIDDQGSRSHMDFTSGTEHEGQPLQESGGVQTLDYLGLDREDAINQRNGAFTQPMRNRASTLASVPSRKNAAGEPSSQLGSGGGQYAEENAYDDEAGEDLYTTYARGLDASQLAAMASAVGLHTPNNSSSHSGRHRAGTVAALGGPGGRQRIEQELMRMTMLSGGTGLNGLGFNSLINSLQGASIGSESRYGKAPLEGFPHLDISTPPLTAALRSSPFHTSPSTPIHVLPSANKSAVGEEGSYSPWNGTAISNGASGSDNNSRSTNQTPSRSLWVGNLDSNTTGQELMHVFAPYGAIESLRLLPEKECGFVNFVEMNDAIRAKEDVLGRLGARLESLGTGPGGTVRIGFGKIDSVPSHTYNKPASLQTTVTSPQGYELWMNNAETGVGSAPMTPGGSEGVGPTRALWVGSIPATVTSAMLLSIFQPFGPVESARILTHKNCGFINFERVDDAVRARKMLNGRDVLGSEVGAMRIGFAKVPTRNVESYSAQGVESGQYEAATDSLGTLKGARSVPRSPEQQVTPSGIENYRSNFVVNLLNQRDSESTALNDASTSQQPVKQSASSSNSIVPASDKGGVPLPPHMAPRANLSDLQLLMGQLSAGQESKEADVASVAEHRPSATYYMTIPLVSEVSSGRRFETSKLRDSRKNIESGQVSTRECDQLAKEYLESIVDLASDYIGNTLVQKFFEHCSESVKMDLLHRLAPHLAMTGCHKNGTWAAQKILDCCKSREQITLIAQHLRPYIPGLLLDQYGNYVVQCCLPWDQPLNDFVFDAMVDRCWEIAQGRFGARSMRACLEKESVTDQQRKRVAMAVILNSVPLATSPNGSILLTWLLDTSGLAKSYKLLAPRFSPHLTHLCTHKLASTPVLRLVNQSFEPEASHTILSALFESEQDLVLEEIVVDQVHGSQFVTKVLASPSLNESQRNQYSGQVRALVEKHRLVGVPAYRRLCEDLGLLVPGLGATERSGRGSGAQFQGLPVSDIIGSQAGGPATPPISSNLGTLRPLPHDAFNPYWAGHSPVLTSQSPQSRTNSTKR